VWIQTGTKWVTDHLRFGAAQGPRRPERPLFVGSGPTAAGNGQAAGPLDEARPPG